MALTEIRVRASASAGLSALLLSGGLLLSSPAQAQQFGSAAPLTPPPDLRGMLIEPRVGLQESFTDNVLLATTKAEADFVTRPVVGADILLNTGRAVGSLATQLSYDQYASHTELSGASLYANGNATYTVVPDFLFLEGEGTVTNGTVSTFGTSAIDRAGTGGRLQLSTYSVGPHVSTTLGDVADLEVQGRFAQVAFTAGDKSAVPILPADSIIGMSSVMLDTGQRFVGFELQTSGNFEHDNHDYQLYNGIQTIFVRILPQLRLIARGGYESITQPKVISITKPVWSGGLELSINEKSTVTVETGERYGHPVWNANALLQFSDRFFATMRYAEVLEPSQISISSSFADFVTQNRLLPVPLVSPNFALNGNIYTQTSLNKTAEARMAYVWDEDSVNVDTSWIDRRFEPDGTHDRTLISSVEYTRHINPVLSADARLSFAHTYASPLYGASQSYGGEVDLLYDLNSTMSLRAGYGVTRQSRYTPAPLDLSENVVFAAIQKRF
jgi:uncharacterized protein (PEP-CTERM system associated)